MCTAQSSLIGMQQRISSEQQYQNQHECHNTSTLGRPTSQIILADKDSKDRVPWNGVVQVGTATGKLVGDFTAPLPWIGPIVELITTIANLCKRVR